MTLAVDVWLCALDAIAPVDELRDFWKGKDNALTSAVVEADRFWVGASRVVSPEEEHMPGAAGRVFELLSMRGTTPEYTLPALTDELARDVLAAFASRDGDELPAASVADLERFLAQHSGRCLVPI
jgi:hypothetical protein